MKDDQIEIKYNVLVDSYVSDFKKKNMSEKEIIRTLSALLSVSFMRLEVYDDKHEEFLGRIKEWFDVN